MKRMPLAIMFLALTAPYVAAADEGLEVRPAGGELFQVRPREIVTTTFRVTNRTDENRLFISEVELPEGWRLITEDFPFELKPHESVAKLVSFLVPETTSIGRYKIKYVVRAREYPAIRDFHTIEVIVLPGRKEKEPQETPPYAIAGEDYRICFSVTNNSQAEDIITISVESSEDIPLTVDSQKFKLGPGQSRIITVTVRPDAGIAKKLKHRLRVTAQIGQSGKPETQASAVHSMEIAPRPESAVGKQSRAISGEDTIRQPSGKVEYRAPRIQQKKKMSKTVRVNPWTVNPKTI